MEHWCWVDIEDTTISTYVFDSEGRITEIYDDDDEYVKYQYTNDSITIYDKDGKIANYYYRYYIENGRIAKSRRHIEYEPNGQNIEYKYSTDGYLIGSIYYAYQEQINEERRTIEDGNVTKMTWGGVEEIISYGDIPNNLNVDLFLFLSDCVEAFTGLFGERVKMLPSFEHSSFDAKSIWEANFTYEFSGEYIKKIIAKGTDEGSTFNATYEIFY